MSFNKVLVGYVSHTHLLYINKTEISLADPAIYENNMLNFYMSSPRTIYLTSLSPD